MFRTLLLSLAFFPLFVNAQTGPRSWQDHVSINYCNSVAKVGSRIYGSNGNGLVYFDQKELSPKTLNKINGLSDVGVRLLRVNPHNNKLLVIYDNCNIDVIDEKGGIRNYPDIKLKILSGKKLINEVTFHGPLAYLACGFGIVVFDTDRMEIRETYYIGPNAAAIDVYQVALDDSLIFAATESGLYQANRLNSSLVNFRNWRKQAGALPEGPYAGVVHTGGKTLCVYSPFRLDGSKKWSDTFYVKQSNIWEKFAPLAPFQHTILKMGPVSGEHFAVIDINGLLIRSVMNGGVLNYVSSFNGEIDYGTTRDGIFAKDHTGNISYWVADARFGLYQTYGYYPYERQHRITLNGTNRNTVSNIDIHNGIVAVSPSRVDNTGMANYSREGINIMKDQEWSYIPALDKDGNEIFDITHVLIDRKDPNILWATSWDYGVLEYRNKKLVNVWTSTNTPSMPLAAGVAPHAIGLAMDKDGNVWFANSETKSFLGVIRRSTRQYQGFRFEEGGFVRRLLIDRNNNIWVLHEREGGITVFRNNNFSQPVAGSNYKKIDNEVGSGALQSKAVYAIAEDQDGKIWVGTAAGISVFYNPSLIFSNSNFDSQPIKIVQDGNVELLLGNEIVTAIVVDGANNKWVGTRSGGVYCFSPDGVRELFHFTKENSSLYSNSVVDLNYNEATGDIFIGTEQGLQSYRSIVLKGEEDFTNVFAYPNPVKPNYQGTVLVRGLVDNSIVKITDVSGNLVWETRSTGGQVEWPVTTLDGRRVSTGVYMVYTMSIDGVLKAATKVLVVNQ